MALSLKGIVNTATDFVKNVSSSINSAGATGKYNNTDFSGATSKAYDAGLTNKKNSSATTQSGIGNTAKAIKANISTSKRSSTASSSAKTTKSSTGRTNTSKSVGLAADSGTVTKSIFSDKDTTDKIISGAAYIIADALGTVTPYNFKPIVSALRTYKPKTLDRPEAFNNAPKSYISSTNDPYEINSLADAVLTAIAPMDLKYNRAVTSDALAKQIAYLERDGASIAEKLQAIPKRIELARTQITQDVILDKTWRPIVERAKEGNIALGAGESFLNTLTNLGETFDITALPIKPLFTGALEAEMGGHGYAMGELGGKYKRIVITPKDYILVPINAKTDPLIKAIGERYKNAFGFGDSGRYNYDYNFDTGSTLADNLLNLTGEVLSDSMNLVEALGKKVVKHTVGDIVDDATKNIPDIIKGAAKDASEEAVDELTKIVSNSFAQAKRLYIRDIFNKNMKFSDVFKDVLLRNAHAHAELFGSGIGDEIFTVVRIIADSAQDALAKSVVVPLTTMLKGWDDIQSAALKGVFLSTPGGLATTGIVKAVKRTLKVIDANKTAAVVSEIIGKPTGVTTALNELRYYKAQTKFTDIIAKRSSSGAGVFAAAKQTIIDSKIGAPVGIIRAKLKNLVKEGRTAEECVSALNAWIAASNLLPDDVVDLPSAFRYFRQTNDADVLEQAIKLELDIADLIKAVPDVDGIAELTDTLRKVLPDTGYTVVHSANEAYSLAEHGVAYRFQQSYMNEFDGIYNALEGITSFKVSATTISMLPKQSVGIEFVYEMQKNVRVYNVLKQLIADTGTSNEIQESIMDTVLKLYNTPVVNLLKEDTPARTAFTEQFFKELHINLYNRTGAHVALTDVEHAQITDILDKLIAMRTENWDFLKYTHSYSLLPRYGLSDAADLRKLAESIAVLDADAAATLNKVADNLIETAYNTKATMRFLNSNIGWITTQGISGLESISTFCFKNTPGISVHKAIVDDTVLRFYSADACAAAKSIGDVSHYYAYAARITQEANAIKNFEYLTKLDPDGVILQSVYDGLVDVVKRYTDPNDALHVGDSLYFGYLTDINYSNLNIAEQYALLHVAFTDLFDNGLDALSWINKNASLEGYEYNIAFSMLRNRNAKLASTVESMMHIKNAIVMHTPYTDASKAFLEASDIIHGIVTGYAFRTPIVSIRNRVTNVISEYNTLNRVIVQCSNRIRALQNILANAKNSLSAQLGYSREYEMMSELLQIQQKAANVLNADVHGYGARVLSDTSEAMRYSLTEHVCRLSDEQLLEYTVLNGRGLVVLSLPNKAIEWRQAVQAGVTDAINPSTALRYNELRQQLIDLGNRTVDGLVIYRIPEHIDDLGHVVPDRVYIGLDANFSNDAFKFKPATESSNLFEVTPEYFAAGLDEASKAAHNYMRETYRLLSKQTGGASRASTGAIMNVEKATEIFSKLPEEFSSRVKNVDDLAAMGAYKGTLFDGTLLCDYAYAKELCRESNRLVVDDMVQSIHYAAQVQDAVTSYANAFFSEASMFRASNLFYGLPKADAFDAVRTNADAIPVRLVKNARSATGMEIVKADVFDIFNKDVIIVTRNQYKQMGKILNKFEVSSPFVKIFNKCIMSPLKASYLHTFGMTTRNIMGALQQNIATSHGFIDAGAWKDSYVKAYRAYGKYHDWFVYALDASKEMGGKGITKEGFAKMCTDLGLSDADIALYRAVNDFINSSASGGLLEEAMEVFKGTADKRDAIDKVSDALNTAVWDYTLMGRITKSLNSYVEQINRLAKYFYELSYGAGTEEALGNVIKAQYNYDKISEAAMYLDIVIPFSGFMISNAQLWADLATENPWAIKLSLELFDATSIYDDKDTAPMDLSNNTSLMYNAMVGNIVLDNGMTIKLSNTMVEAMKIAMMPFTTITGSLAAPLALPIDWAKDTINGKPWTAADWKFQLGQLIPVYGMWAMRYSTDTQYTIPTDEGKVVIVPRGSALRAAQRLGMEFSFSEEDSNIKRLLGLLDPNEWSNWDTAQTLVMLFPSLFGSTSRKYYFTYDGLKMYSTKNKSEYLDYLANGAQAVYSQKDYDAAYKAYKNITRYAYQFKGGEVVITDDYNRYLDAIARGAVAVPYTQKELFAKVIAQRVENIRPDEGPAKYAYQYTEGGKVYYTAQKDVYDEAITKGALPVYMTEQEIAALKAAWEQQCAENPVYIFYYDGLRYTTGSKEVYDKYLAEGATAGADKEYKKYIYGFKYGDKVFATTDPNKFKHHLDKGAEAVALSDAEIDNIYAQWNLFYSADTPAKQQTKYNKKSYKRTYKTYTRSYSSYRNYRSRAFNSYTRTSYNQYNNPAYWLTADASRTKPYRSTVRFNDVYRQVYTKRHKDKFKSRMLSFGKASTGLPLLKSRLRYYVRL